MKKFKCCSCEKVSTAGEINNTTLTQCCVNREQRRKYTPIEKTKRSDRKWYQCPKCGKNIRRFGWAEVEDISNE